MYVGTRTKESNWEWKLETRISNGISKDINNIKVDEHMGSI